MTPPRESLGRAYFIDQSRPPATVMAEPLDKLRVAVDRRFGLTPARLERIYESLHWSAQEQARLLDAPWVLEDPRRTERDHLRVHRDFPSRLASLESLPGLIHEALSAWPLGRARESQSQAEAVSMLGNTLRREFLQAFVEPEYGEFSIARRGSSPDLRQQQVVAMEEPGDLPAIDPEANDYTEMGALRERVMPFSITQYGRIITITRKYIKNDDIGAISRIVSGQGRAARRALARAIWSKWVNNTTFSPDATTWFHANHNNAQTSAISKTEVLAARLKLATQTQPGNGEKMGPATRPGSLWLVVPPALWDAAAALNQETGSALFHLFGENNQFIIENPLLTDANDWGLHRDARDAASLQVNFLGGREEPEFLLADAPTADQALIGDKIAYKVRFEFGVGLVEFRAAVRASVA